MEQWISAIKSCYEVQEEKLDIENNLFDILNGGAKGRAIRVICDEDMAAYSWKTDEGDFIIACGISEPREKDLPEKVEEILKALLGDRESSLYVARNIVVDDMFGVEVCGGTLFDEMDSTFYGAYLTDGVDAFSLVGFANGDPEIVFDELSGAARTFFRKPFPATIENGKNFNEMFNATRELAKVTVPMTTEDYAIANTTFTIEDGIINVKPSVIIITKDDVVHLDTDEVDIDFTNPIKEFTEIMNDFSDMAGFTVTNFSDGRYGITYYPEDPMEDDEHEHHHHDDEDYLDELGKDPKDINPDLMKLSNDIAKSFDDSWKNGMAIVNYDGEFYSLSAYFSDGDSSYKVTEIPDNLDEKINEQLDFLGDILDEDYNGWNTLAFAFERVEGNNDVEEFSLRYEIFDFDIFIDSSDYDDKDDNAYFADAAELFIEELNSSKTPVSAISLKIVSDELGKFVIEDATLSTPNGIEMALTSDKYKAEIFRITDEVLARNIEFDTINFTIFPNGLVGCSLEMNSGEVFVTKDNIDEVIEDSDMLEYSEGLKEVARPEIIGLVYEVDTEESVKLGRSRIGGYPDLPKGSSWPKGKNGKTLPFVAQVNLKEVADADSDNALPKSGILSFFYKDETKECKVLFNEGKEVENVDIPDDVIETEEYLESVLRFVPALSFPSNVDIDFNCDEDCENYDAAFVKLGGNKLLGYPDLIDYDDDIISEENDDVLLFQLSSNTMSEMEFGDQGTLYFVINRNDLKAKRFENIRCILQTY